MKYKEFKQILLEKGFTYNPHAGMNYAKFRLETSSKSKFEQSIYINDYFIEFQSLIPGISLGDHTYFIDGRNFHNAYDFYCNSRGTSIKWDIYFGGTTLSRKSESEYTHILSIIDYILSGDAINDVKKELDRLSKINSIDTSMSMSEINAYVQNGDIKSTNNAIHFRMRGTSSLVITIDTNRPTNNMSKMTLSSILPRTIEGVLDTSDWVYIYDEVITINLEVTGNSRIVNYIKMFEDSELTDNFLQLISDVVEEVNEETYE